MARRLINIPGFAFFGREPYSFIQRTEERYQFVDNFSISKGRHDIKFGGDDHIHLRGTGTFHPVSPGAFGAGGAPGASATASGSSRGCARARSACDPLTFPYHPHVTVAHDLPYDVLQRAFDEMASYDVRFEVWGLQPLRARRGRRVAPAAGLPARAGAAGTAQRVGR